MRYSWRQTGYGQLPHILGSIALPKMTRLVTEDLYRRGFNSGCSVQVAESLLAADMGCSARTYIRHLNISEYVGFIRRRRLGEGNVNIIDLLLRPSDGQGAHMSAGILAQLPHLHPALFKDEQHTMEWWFVQVARHKEAMRPVFLPSGRARWPGVQVEGLCPLAQMFARRALSSLLLLL